MSDNQVIPDAAVEAAVLDYASAACDKPTPCEKCKDNASRIVRAVLTSAAPFMMAAAWEQGRETFSAYTPNPYQVDVQA